MAYKYETFARLWNEFRLRMGDKALSFKEITDAATMENLPYAKVIPSRLVKDGLLVKVGDKFVFSDRNIHISYIKALVDFYRARAIENNRRKARQEKETEVVPSQSVSESAVRSLISAVMDSYAGEGLIYDFVSELKERGILGNDEEASRFIEDLSAYTSRDLDLFQIARNVVGNNVATKAPIYNNKPMSDQELVDTLRRRGYDVRAEKVIIL